MLKRRAEREAGELETIWSAPSSHKQGSRGRAPSLQPCYTDQNLTDLVWTLVQDSDPVHLPELVTDVDQT